MAGGCRIILINSNTQGGKFVTNIVQDRPNIIPPEKATGTVLESLQKTDVALELGKYGQNVAPLNDIGKFPSRSGRESQEPDRPLQRVFLLPLLYRGDAASAERVQANVESCLH